MRSAIGLVLCTCLLSCTQVEPEELMTSEGSGALTALPSGISAYPVEDWDSRSEVTWPAGATTVQVLIRRGHDATATRGATFYVFLVSDGARLSRTLRVAVSQHGGFMDRLNYVLAAAALPGSSRWYSMAGSLWNGPAPGPPGDDLPLPFVARIIRSAGQLEDSIDAAMKAPM
jgi:hypothetical protein